jgi:hypothetical protein
VSGARGSTGANNVAAVEGSRRTGANDVYRYSAQTNQAVRSFNVRAYSSVSECMTAAFAAGQPLGQCE